MSMDTNSWIRNGKKKVQEIRKRIHKFDIKTDELGLQFNGLKKR